MTDQQHQPGRVQIEVDHSSSRPIYLQIVDSVRASVAEGALRPGDPLPSIRDVAGRLQVSPNTVAQAYRELERAGITYVLRGRGTFISEADWVEHTAERTRIARALVREMFEKALRHGLTRGEVRSILNQCLATEQC